MLLDHGHRHAMRYPVWMVSAEARIVAKRLDVQLAAHTSLLQMALSSIPNMNVKTGATNRAAKELGAMLKGMLHGE